MWAIKPLNAPSAVTSSSVTAILLNGSSVGATFQNIGAQNAGDVIAAVTLVGGPQSTALVVSGTTPAGNPFGSGVAYSTLMGFTNGGFVPCNLIALVDLPDSTNYTNVTLSCT